MNARRVRNPSPSRFAATPSPQGGGESAAGGIVVRPANEASWDELQKIFGARGEAAVCWCQRYKLQPREAFKHWPPEIRAERLRRQTNCGDPRARTTSGLV